MAGVQIQTLLAIKKMTNLKSTQPVHMQLLTPKPRPFFLYRGTRSTQSCTETDMETIIAIYNNMWFNLEIMLDWILLRLTVTKMRSGEWIDLGQKGNCVGVN